MNDPDRKNDVLEPEVIEPGQPYPPRKEQNMREEERQGRNVIYQMYSSHAFGRAPGAVPPFTVALMLAVVSAFSFGILAAISFLVFAGIFSVIMFFAMVRSTMQGKPMHPALYRWGGIFIAFVLVAWLSGAFK